MNNEINKMLLKDKINYDKLKSYFDYEFDEIIDDFFDVITKFINSNNKKNIVKVKQILAFLKTNVGSWDNDKLDVIVINFLDIKHNIKNTEIILQTDDLLNNIYYEHSDDYKFDMGKFLCYMIYDDRNLKRIKIFLNGVDRAFFVSEQYDNIFSNLLKSFNTTDRDIKNYYYKVSLMLLDKMGSSLLAKSRDRYLNILDELTVHSEYTDDLTNLLNGNYVSDDVLLSRFGIYFDFPYKHNFNVNINTNDIPNLRQEAITIDRNNTLRMDDAIFFKKNKDNTYTLYVHVSFVPSLISYDSIVNEEARRRYKSIYTFDKVVPILPNELVLNKCSLIKNNYKNTVTFSIKADKDMNIMPDTFKIVRTNVRVVNNYDYSMVDMIIRSGNDDEVSNMLKDLTIFSLNNFGDKKIDVERAFRDNDYYGELISDINLSHNIVSNIMRCINYNVSKYFRDRGWPYLYKYTCFMDDDFIIFDEAVRGNKSLMRYDDLISEMKDSFFDIKLSSEAKSFFELDCYSSSTDPLWKYSALYNQYLLNNFVFLKNNGTDSVEEWYNITRALAKELNLKKQNNKDVETVCKSLSRIRSRY